MIDTVIMFLLIAGAVLVIVVTLMIDNAWWDWLRKVVFWAVLAGLAAYLAIRFLT